MSQKNKKKSLGNHPFFLEGGVRKKAPQTKQSTVDSKSFKSLELFNVPGSCPFLVDILENLSRHFNMRFMINLLNG